MTTTTVLPSGVERKVERFCFEVNQFFFFVRGPTLLFCHVKIDWFFAEVVPTSN